MEGGSRARRRRAVGWRKLALALGAWLLAGCGPRLPPRGVLERDLDGYAFRRYQRVLDIELPVQGNPAVGHTATYIRRGRTLSVAPAFVTVYTRAAGLAEAVRRSLRNMDAYTYGVTKLHGAYVWSLVGDSGDRWLLWVHGRHLVKLGVPEGAEAAPEAISEAYLDAYPSDLDSRGRAREGAASAGSPPQEGAE